MIFEEQKQSKILSDGEDTQDSIKMSLDMDSAQILMQMLSKNLYSDAIGSTIREAASNALDSHRRAGVNKPIVVTLNYINGNYEFSVEDFGIGLDDDDVKNIISKYGKSTKRDSNTELGMMGLGFKAPLAYCSSFIFIARKNGMERKYMMYEGESVNTIDLMDERETTEDNGVKIIVPVQSRDYNEFARKIREQLAYFENVYFDVSGVSNNFSILRSEHFQYSELTSDNYMHICLDNVYYPIDWSKIGIPAIDMGIGLRFKLTDGLYPTPNRESIRYTQEAKAAILEKIKKVANYFLIKLNKYNNNTSDLLNVLDYYRRSERLVKLNERDYNISSLMKYATVPVIEPQIPGCKYIQSKDIFRLLPSFVDGYELRYTISDRKMSEAKSWDKSLKTRYVEREDDYIFEMDNVVGANMREYLKYLVKFDNAYLVSKKEEFNLSDYKAILHLLKYPKDTWRARIKEFQHLRSLYLAKIKKISEITIPKEWLDARKVKREYVSRGPKLEGDILCKESQHLERYMHKRYCKFVPATYKMEKIPITGKLFIYDLYDNAPQLELLFPFSDGEKIKLLTFSQRELKIIKTAKFHNLISYEEFMKGNNKPFKRIATHLLLSDFISEYRMVFVNLDYLKNISTPLYEKLIKLKEYANQKYYNTDKDVKDAILKTAKANSLWDMEIYPLYEEMRDTLKRLKFLEPLFGSIKTGYGQRINIDDILRDLFRYYRYKMNPDNYKIVLNDDPKEEEDEEDEDDESPESLSEDIITDLANESISNNP